MFIENIYFRRFARVARKVLSPLSGVTTLFFVRGMRRQKPTQIVKMPYFCTY